MGIHKLQLKISDGQLWTTLDMFVELYNAPPYFIDKKPEDMKLKFNNSFEFVLPPYKDAEGNRLYLYLTGRSSMFQFIKWINSEKILINPTQWSQVGSWIVNLTLSDT
jgi:hypothetical protein